MAALTSAGVTINEVWYSGDIQRPLKCLDVTLVLSSQGSLTTNTIAASLFGLTKIEETTPGVDADSGIWQCGPSYAKDYLVFYNVENATDAARRDVADITATVRLVVKGKE